MRRPRVYVAMPFNDTSEKRFAYAIKPACDDAGVDCERSDQLAYHGSVTQQIFSEIAGADAIVADVSELNPNVALELGYALALGKRALLIARRPDDVPSDMRNLPVIIYEDRAPGLKAGLVKALSLFRGPQEAGAEAEAAILSPPTAQRMSAIVVGDIVWSTKMQLTLGELDVSTLLMKYRDHAHWIAGQEGAYGFRTLGDGFVAVFETALAALNFALEIQRTRPVATVSHPAPVEVRLGIHFAQVTVRRTPYGDDFIGEGVAIAAQLASAAQPGEIALSKPVASSLPQLYLALPSMKTTVLLQNRERIEATVLLGVGSGNRNDRQ